MSNIKKSKIMSESDIQKVHSIIKKFATELFEKEYSKEDMPKWVNFDMFKEEIIFIMIESISFDLKNENREDNKIHWMESLLFPLYSSSLNDTEDMFNAMYSLGIYDYEYPLDLLQIPYYYFEVIYQSCKLNI